MGDVGVVPDLPVHYAGSVPPGAPDTLSHHHSTLVFVVVALLLAFSALVLVGHVRAVEAENELLRQQPFLTLRRRRRRRRWRRP